MMSAGNVVYADVQFNKKPTQRAGQVHNSTSYETTYSDVRILQPWSTHPSKDPQDLISSETTYSDVRILQPPSTHPSKRPHESLPAELTYAEVKIPQRSHSSNESNKSNGESKVNFCSVHRLKIILVAVFLLLAVCVIITVALMTTPTTKDPKCPSEWVQNGRTCYYLSNDKLNWSKSQEDCINRGGHLAIIHSKEEQVFLHNITKNKMNGDEKFWIGLTDKDEEGKWMWVDNSTMTLSFWFSNNENQEEPDNWKGKDDEKPDGEDCVRFGEKDDGYKFKCWFDSFCEKTQRRICETMAT